MTHVDAGSYSVRAGVVDASQFAAWEYAIVQYDSRPLKDYWLASAAWNREYCKRHGHTFIYYALKPGETCKAVGGEEPLADAWCKVKAMITAQQQYPQVKLFIYMDSDAVMSHKFEDVPLSHMLSVLQRRLQWDPDRKPMVFNQDGPCWWCNQVARVGYSTCLNAGTVLWYSHPNSLQVLQDWWAAALDSYDGQGNPFKRKFRLKWPWEQDRQVAIYHRNPSYIQVASDPDHAHIQNDAGVGGAVGAAVGATGAGSADEPWCLSHLAKASCFIAHHCEDKKSKARMMRLYSGPATPVAALSMPVSFLEMEVPVPSE